MSNCGSNDPLSRESFSVPSAPTTAGTRVALGDLSLLADNVRVRIVE